LNARKAICLKSAIDVSGIAVIDALLHERSISGGASKHSSMTLQGRSLRRCLCNPSRPSKPKVQPVFEQLRARRRAWSVDGVLGNTTGQPQQRHHGAGADGRREVFSKS